MTTYTGPSRSPEALGQRIGRALDVGISIGGFAVFVALWVGFAIGLATGGQLFADAWDWLLGLEPVATVVVWILFLPICVGLWALEGGLPTFATILLGLALIPWTAVAVNGLRKTLARR